MSEPDKEPVKADEDYAELRDKLTEWKALNVTAVAAENQSVFEYVSALEKRVAESEAARLAALATTETAEELAQMFHRFYEELAVEFGYETRKESAKPWVEVPEPNRSLMIRVCQHVLVSTQTRLSGEKEARLAAERERDEALHRCERLRGQNVVADYEAEKSARLAAEKERDYLSESMMQIATAFDPDGDTDCDPETLIGAAGLTNELREEMLAEAAKCESMRKTLCFFASVIKSGESWTKTCKAEFDKVLALTPSAALLADRLEGRKKAFIEGMSYGRKRQIYTGEEAWAESDTYRQLTTQTK